MTYSLAMLGRWSEALARLSEIPEAQLSDGAQQALGLLNSALEIHLHQGRLEQAQEVLHAYDRFERSEDEQARSIYNAALAAIRLAEGSHRAALSAAEQALAVHETQGIATQGPKFGFLHAVEAALALGEQAKATELVEWVEALPPGLRPPLLEASVHRFRGRLAGEDPGADRHFLQAAAQFRSLELPFYLAVVQLEHGEWLTTLGRPDDAQALLAEARDTFERLRAQPWLDRVDAATRSTPAETVA
jgi:tetratricopeptide (TPR) repeat protein